MTNFNVYTLECANVTVSQAMTLLQLKAGAGPLDIVRAEVMVDSIAPQAMQRVQICRLSSGGTVTATNPIQYDPDSPTSGVTVGTTGTGITSTAEGGLGAALVDSAFHVYKGWSYAPRAAERIQVRTGDMIALRIPQNPSSPLVLSARITWYEPVNLNTGGSGGTPNANLCINCTAFGASSWVPLGSATVSGTTVSDPNGSTTPGANLVNLVGSRSGFSESLGDLSPNTTYTASIYLIAGSTTGPLYLGYFDGINPVSQYSGAMTATAAWQQFSKNSLGATPFTFTTGPADAANVIEVVNANTQTGTGAAGTIGIWGIKVELGNQLTTFQGCAINTASSLNYFLSSQPDDTGLNLPQLINRNMDALQDFNTNTSISTISGARIGTKPMVDFGVHLLEASPGTNNNPASAANGTYNSLYLSMAQALNNFKTGVCAVSIAAESNGTGFIDGYAGGSGLFSATQFYQAFQNCATQIKNTIGTYPNAGSIPIVWSTLHGGILADPAYPGDGFVDMIGMDLFDNGGVFTNNGAGLWNDWVNGSACNLTWLDAFLLANYTSASLANGPRNKNLLIGFNRWGVGATSGDAAGSYVIHQMSAWMNGLATPITSASNARKSQVAINGYWDTTLGSPSALSTLPDSQSAYKYALSGTSYGGNWAKVTANQITPTVWGPLTATTTAIPTPFLGAWYNATSHTIASILADTNGKRYNYLSFVEALSTSSNATLHLQYAGAIYSSDAAVKTDIQAWTASTDAKGNKRVFVMLIANGVSGGGNATFLGYPTNLTNYNQAIASLIGNPTGSGTNFFGLPNTSGLIDTFGFQGVDWDLEISSDWDAATINAINAALKAHFGSSFIIAQSPRPYECTSGGIKAAFLNSHDLNTFQYYVYVSGGVSCSNLQSFESGTLGDGMSQWVAASVPQNKCVFGNFVAGQANSCTNSGALTAFQNVIVTYPNVRGVMAWQSDADASNSYNYASIFGAQLGL